MKKKIILNSPARIHLGFLDISESSQRQFGSLGLTISKFKNEIIIENSEKFQIYCSDKTVKKQISNILKVFRKSQKLVPCKITVKSFIPRHVGLGSGTQMALSAGYLISEFNNIKIDLDDISKITGRGKRSGIGIQSFKTGGFIIDAGKKKASNEIPLTIFEKPWPQNWKLILIFDGGLQGIHGQNEINKFKNLSDLKKKISHANTYTVLMKIIPSILEIDFKSFVEGIQIIQENITWA